MMQKMKITDLIPHPQNDYFFDNITGDAWDEFVKSIATSGIIEPIVATQDRVIVSGHQRIRAAKQLGMDEVLVEVRAFDSEDDVLRALIETNIRQRGAGNPNPVKFGRCLMELERIYGIGHGGDRKSKLNNSTLKTESDLAEELGVKRHTIQNYKILAKSIPEIQELLESGKISATSALGIIRHLSEDDQKTIAREIASEEAERVTTAQIETLKQRLKEAEDNNDFFRRRLSEEHEKGIKARKALEEMESREPEVVEKIVEVEKKPDDYDALKAKARQADAYRQDYRNEQARFAEQQKKVLALQDEIAELKRATAEGLDRKNLSENVAYFCTVCNNFIGTVGGLVWLTDRIADMPEHEKEIYLKAAYSFKDWALAFSQNLERSTNGKEN